MRLILLRAWLPAGLVAAWWLASASSTSLYFPPLQTILETLGADWAGPSFAGHLLPSIGKFLAGFLIAAVAGIFLGLVIGMYPALRAAVEPIVQFLRSLPPPVLLPVGLLVFGIGASMNIAIIAFGAVWPTLLNTIDGVRSLDPQLTEMTRSYRLTRAQKIRWVILPNASPQIFAGLRTTLQMAIILIVVSEMVASTNGIGYYVLNSQQTFAVPQTWAGTLVLGALGYLANLVFIRIEGYVLRWQAGLLAITGSGA
ncbi:ABC transporter permease [Arthrobacter sp. E918]|uniref:ABC transporter permease n=1 Tax=Arthrobacter mobilis TaxID=2724944 RepID=A0A7X6HEQ1_9MICC|nr:ABC transporter permease [Arthrobacter mobilis]